MDLGRTFALGPWQVHRLGYGAMQLAGDNVFGPPRDRDEALRVLRAAVDSGINHIDTAQYYGPGVVNELIREALYPYPSDLAIVSKWPRCAMKPARSCRATIRISFAQASRTTSQRSAFHDWLR